MTEGKSKNNLEATPTFFPLELAQFAKGLKVGEAVLVIKNQRECLTDVALTLVKSGCKVFRVYGGATESASATATYLIFFEAADMTISLKELTARIASLDAVLKVLVRGTEELLVDTTAIPLLELGSPALIFRCSLIAEIEQSLERIMGRKAVSTLHWAGLQVGRQDAEWLKGILRDISRNELFEKLLDMKQSAGWGIFEIKYAEEYPRMVVVRNSFEATARTSIAAEPSCHLMKGYLAGTLTTIYQKPTYVAENKCKSQGNPSCEFLLETG